MGRNPSTICIKSKGWKYLCNYLNELIYLQIFVKWKYCNCRLPFLYASLQDVDASEIKVQVCVYAFDLLYLNGEVRLGADGENINQTLLSARFLSSEITHFVFVSIFIVYECAIVRRLTEMPTMPLNANDGATRGCN